ncbi:hypothetical protein TNCV_1201 [Trichonephila clavipes]|nr:hypothetical protein TNCV_1201 [Trichonephila clavipes]
MQKKNNSTRQYERNNSTQQEKTTQLGSRNETTQLRNETSRRPPTIACNRLQPPVPPLQQNRLFLPTVPAYTMTQIVGHIKITFMNFSTTVDLDTNLSELAAREDLNSASE